MRLGNVVAVAQRDQFVEHVDGHRAGKRDRARALHVLGCGEKGDLELACVGTIIGVEAPGPSEQRREAAQLTRNLHVGLAAAHQRGDAGSGCAVVPDTDHEREEEEEGGAGWPGRVIRRRHERREHDNQGVAMQEQSACLRVAPCLFVFASSAFAACASAAVSATGRRLRFRLCRPPRGGLSPHPSNSVIQIVVFPM